jgi:SMC interacting uncharacterized protein involved in chromosome segregation
MDCETRGENEVVECMKSLRYVILLVVLSIRIDIPSAIPIC